MIEKHELRTDSGGAGRQRGGLGTEVVIRALSPITVSCLADRMHCVPWGLHGGHSGLGNRVTVQLDGIEIKDSQNS